LLKPAIKSQKTHEVISELKRKAALGPPVLQFAFRPFFLLAGIWAALALPLWVAHFLGTPVLPPGIDALNWHQHEMIYGFCLAAATGYILTAIPNWTGRLPSSGSRLALLAGLWLLGRAAFVLSDAIGPWLAAAGDLSLLFVLCAAIARELISARTWRNLPVLLLFIVFFIGNALVHMENLGFADSAASGNRLGIYVLVILVAVIGGRMVPSFTRNFLSRQGAESLPAPVGFYDRFCLAALALFMPAYWIWPETQPSAVGAIIVAGLHIFRLVRWRGHATGNEPLVWALHLGYGWVVLGVGMLGIAGLTDWLFESAALHALTIGGFGTMIMAMMCRMILSYAGRPSAAGPMTTFAFLLLSMAALLRIVTPELGEFQEPALWVSGGAWTAAFLIFNLVYFPLLVRRP
jgi:uncharacterized protein involved in response to NO